MRKLSQKPGFLDFVGSHYVARQYLGSVGKVDNGIVVDVNCFFFFLIEGAGLNFGLSLKFFSG